MHAIGFLTIGLPVIVSRTKTIEHYFNDDMLFFFTPENVNDFVEQVLLVYKDPGLVDKKVENSIKWIQRYNWGEEKNKYVHFIKSLV